MSWFKDLLRNPPPTATGPSAETACANASAPTPLPDPDAARAAMGAADKQLAMQWLAHLNDDRWLGEIAVQGRFAEVRLAAVQRIADPEVLAQVARLSRGKDKGVFRHCYDVLRDRRHRADRQRRATQLRGNLEALLASSPLSVTRLLDLQAELQAIEDSESLGECRALFEQANERLRHEAEARRRLQTLREEAEQLSVQCAATVWPDSGQFEGWRGRCDALAQAQDELPRWLADKVASQSLAASLQLVQSRLTHLAADEARARECEQFLSVFEAGPVPAESASKWETLAKPDHPHVRQQLLARWQELQAQQPATTDSQPQVVHEPRPPPQRPDARPRLDTVAIRAWVEQMERALEEGHLADADAYAKKIKAAVGHAALRGSLASRMHRASAQLAQLSGWAKWGAAQQREHLIAEAEEMATANHGVEQLARAIPALREQWKHMSEQSPPPHGEWERFDAALTKAYEPVSRKRAEEAARRAQARSDKEALCAEWEAFAAAIDWERPDYGSIESQRTVALKRWRSSAMAGFRDERALRKRFEAALGAVDQRVAAARSTDIARRQELIAAAEALREAPDLRAAMAEARSLQERWRAEAIALRLPRTDEQTLWRRFRAACDAVFARRDAQRAEQVAQREQRALARIAMLDALQAELQAADPAQVKRALAQFRTSWTAAQAGPGEDALEARARQLQRQGQHRIDALQRDSYRVRLEALARQEPLDGQIDAGVLAESRKTRESVLIELEIALDLPTPEQFAAARRHYQLERLQNRFRGVRQQRPRAEELLAQWHAAKAAPDEALGERMAAVVRKLLEQQQSGTGG